ncbi:MAG: hypothetical protein JOS17DRAFT_781445 [Linnemannia elongata]|nr:MAG: hypothetical protein JOS17DRAFT_781445 [Linnemannia elongata]
MPCEKYKKRKFTKNLDGSHCANAKLGSNVKVDSILAKISSAARNASSYPALVMVASGLSRLPPTALRALCSYIQPFNCRACFGLLSGSTDKYVQDPTAPAIVPSTTPANRQNTPGKEDDRGSTTGVLLETVIF